MFPQRSIGHYRVGSKLGEGGMGEVWLATDTRLNRDVAIKTLPESYAADPDRLARFTREAQLLAGLNHPNIAAIYNVEDRALVLEYVPGPTLADRIAQSAIPVEEALPIARQIAEALEYIAPDGNRFIVFPRQNPLSETKENLHVVFLLNFFDELRRRVP